MEPEDEERRRRSHRPAVAARDMTWREALPFVASLAVETSQQKARPAAGADLAVPGAGTEAAAFSGPLPMASQRLLQLKPSDLCFGQSMEEGGRLSGKQYCPEIPSGLLLVCQVLTPSFQGGSETGCRVWALGGVRKHESP